MYKLSPIWSNISKELFSHIEEVLPPLSDKQCQLTAILELIRIEDYAGTIKQSFFGRPQKDRVAIARAFIAKAVYNFTTTRLLIEQLKSNETLRRLCGWHYRRDIPSESTFSRAFDEFAKSSFPARIHDELIKTQMQDHLVGHISRDSTAIEGNEKPAPVKKKSLKSLRNADAPEKTKNHQLSSQRELNIN
jgi:hypothetical protein